MGRAFTESIPTGIEGDLLSRRVKEKRCKEGGLVRGDPLFLARHTGHRGLTPKPFFNSDSVLICGNRTQTWGRTSTCYFLDSYWGGNTRTGNRGRTEQAQKRVPL